jgi:hypothetical protein
MTTNKKTIINSNLFKGILKLVCDKKIKEPFKVFDVKSVLKTSTPFLSKHCIDPTDPKKKATGNSYFIRVSIGSYKINPSFKTCP